MGRAAFRSHRSPALALVVAGASVLFDASAWGQTQRDYLAEAEAAYAQIDFDQVKDNAQRAIDRGGYSRSQLARSYFLLGVARAALGEDGPARDAFLRMLELDPETRADRGLSPRLRGPLLEARGAWASRSARMTLDVQFDRRGEALLVTLADPLSMGRTIRARFRTGGAWTERSSPVAPTWRVEVPSSATATVECVFVLADAAGNELVTIGTEAQPRVFAAPAVASTRAAGASRPSLIAPAAVVLGVGVVGAGLAAAGLALRESNAARWNDDAMCLSNTGMTREETCRDARVGAETWQSVFIASTVVGSAALVTSAILFAVSPRAEAAPRVACLVLPTMTGAQASCSFTRF